MPSGQFYINNHDAYTYVAATGHPALGVSLTDTALSALMTPPAMKEDIVNESRLEHGRRHASTGNMVQERELSLPIHITAKSQADYLTQYNDLISILQGVELNIKTSFQTGVVYKCRYVSCTQFTQFINGMAKLVLKLVEPDPTDRTASGGGDVTPVT